MKLFSDTSVDYDQVLIIDINGKSVNGQVFHDYLVQKRESEVDNIVATIEKTGLDYVKLVQHYLRINGAPEKVVSEAADKLNVKKWETLMEECGY